MIPMGRTAAAAVLVAASACGLTTATATAAYADTPSTRVILCNDTNAQMKSVQVHGHNQYGQYEDWYTPFINSGQCTPTTNYWWQKGTKVAIEYYIWNRDAGLECFINSNASADYKCDLRG